MNMEFLLLIFIIYLLSMRTAFCSSCHSIWVFIFPNNSVQYVSFLTYLLITFLNSFNNRGACTDPFGTFIWYTFIPSPHPSLTYSYTLPFPIYNRLLIFWHLSLRAFGIEHGEKLFRNPITLSCPGVLAYSFLQSTVADWLVFFPSTEAMLTFHWSYLFVITKSLMWRFWFAQ